MGCAQPFWKLAIDAMEVVPRGGLFPPGRRTGAKALFCLAAAFNILAGVIEKIPAPQDEEIPELMGVGGRAGDWQGAAGERDQNPKSKPNLIWTAWVTELLQEWHLGGSFHKLGIPK